MPAFQITIEGNIQFPEGPHSLFILKKQKQKTAITSEVLNSDLNSLKYVNLKKKLSAIQMFSVVKTFPGCE